MNTVECIQAYLIGVGCILWPGTPENPPQQIKDEDIFYEAPRVFDKPNEDGPLFEYERNVVRGVWNLKREQKLEGSDARTD